MSPSIQHVSRACVELLFPASSSQVAKRICQGGGEMKTRDRKRKPDVKSNHYSVKCPSSCVFSRIPHEGVLALVSGEEFLEAVCNVEAVVLEQVERPGDEQRCEDIWIHVLLDIGHFCFNLVPLGGVSGQLCGVVLLFRTGIWCPTKVCLLHFLDELLEAD
ncbi:hypothetical protein LX32DRAFT_73354 [Colletotrichum zoysiae]|uniref:Uncharacterized protein n=1 Tax=Colletotrichum zoysiae TaxID=1216348 RepID=A0AAD9HQS7_9PEZI|nr:hypothetical protein LX32DRAFT_73354 [Colletotrichum zoysiae]